MRQRKKIYHLHRWSWKDINLVANEDHKSTLSSAIDESAPKTKPNTWNHNLNHFLSSFDIIAGKGAFRSIRRVFYPLKISFTFLLQIIERVPFTRRNNMILSSAHYSLFFKVYSNASNLKGNSKSLATSAANHKKKKNFKTKSTKKRKQKYIYAAPTKRVIYLKCSVNIHRNRNSYLRNDITRLKCVNFLRFRVFGAHSWFVIKERDER